MLGTPAVPVNHQWGGGVIVTSCFLFLSCSDQSEASNYHFTKTTSTRPNPVNPSLTSDQCVLIIVVITIIIMMIIINQWLVIYSLIWQS